MTHPEPRLPVSFVEDKPIDVQFIEGVLAESRLRNHWTNFGPASLALEDATAAHLALPDDRTVVVTSSGTAALYATVALDEHTSGMRRRWAVSAFGFWCTRLGPLSESIVVDCDEHGMLSLGALERIDPASYDGVIVTNVFGLAFDLSPYVEFCRRRGKALICDAAAAFDAGHRAPGDGPLVEIVSFHHTKPWGMGEGGCMIVPADDVMPARSLINFGLVEGAPVGAAATNAKMSDLAAAAILQRLRDLPSVREQSRVQYRRIATIGESLGYRLLAGEAKPALQAATPPCVPLLAQNPVPVDALPNPNVVIRKYYVPVESGHPTADGLYARIVNLPSHPGMAVLLDEEIEQVLAGLMP